MAEAAVKPPLAMILAAGLGTRLRPLTDELPKPLCPIGDRPALSHIGVRLAEAGIRQACLNTHHLAAAFSGEQLAALPLDLRVLHEPRILGTAGGIANAAPHLGDGDVVVWNGDILADLDVGALLEAHAKEAALATLAVAPRPRGEGTVGLGVDGAVVRLRGERFGEETAGGDFMGIQAVSAALRRRLPEVGCLVGDGYLPALREGGRILGARFDGAFRDIGTLSAYLGENLRWLAQTRRSAHVGEGAQVGAAVRLVESVIGARATVTGEGALSRVVVWPGARAVAPLEDAVVTTGGAVVRVPRGG
jgi:mannose-1-phosphate guanylyltransferase